MFRINKERKIKSLKRVSEIISERQEKYSKMTPEEQKESNILQVSAIKTKIKVRMINEDFSKKEIDYGIDYIIDDFR